MGSGPRPSPAPGPPSRSPADLYLDGPPPAHTGGFGEPSCHACHFDGPPNASEGSLRLEGVPDRYGGDSLHVLSLELRHPDLRRGGFEISARFADGERAGEQAGRWERRGERLASTTSESGVDYLHHAEDGTGPARDSIRWELVWRPPGRACGAVVFHVAANAADGDASEFGDLIYLDEAITRP